MNVEIFTLEHSILHIKQCLSEPKHFIDLSDKLDAWQSAEVFYEGGNEKKKFRETDVLHCSLPPYPKKELEPLNELASIGVQAYTEYMQIGQKDCGIASEGFQILRYHPGGFYDTHIDGWSIPTRQISIIIFLNGDFEGGGLHFPRQKIIIKPEAGDAVFFPSNFSYPHAALPVTSGVRYSVVNWLSVIPPQK